MANQILNNEERRKIRAGLYVETENQSINYKDKNKLLCKQKERKY